MSIDDGTPSNTYTLTIKVEYESGDIVTLAQTYNVVSVMDSAYLK